MNQSSNTFREMEKKQPTFLILYLLAFAVAIPTARSLDRRPEAVQAWFKSLPNLKEKLATFRFYFHDIVSGKNPTAYAVAKAKITGASPTSFGLMRMVDDPLTVGPEPDSKIVGRLQGMYGAAAFDEVGLLMNLNILLTEGEYKGSTLSVAGRDAILDEYREMPIVGGSGVFRLARGIATARTVWFNVSSEDAVVELSVVVLYYTM